MAASLPDGFYDLKLGTARDYPLALKPGMMLDGPVFAAKYRMPAPFKDVQIVVPIHREAVTAWKRGDPSVATVIGVELENALNVFLRGLVG